MKRLPERDFDRELDKRFQLDSFVVHFLTGPKYKSDLRRWGRTPKIRHQLLGLRFVPDFARSELPSNG